MVTRILALIAPLAGGAILGAILGGIITGSGDYAIVWGIGLPIAIILIVAVAVANTPDRKAKKAAAAQPVGINQTVTGVAPQGTVLNGEPLTPATVSAVMARPDLPRRPVRLRRGIAILLVLAGMAVVLIPAYPMIGWIASDFAHGRPFDGRDMRTGLHQNDAMAQIADVVGSPDITRVNFYEDYVIVTARTSPRSTTVDTYMWRYGGAFRSGPGSFEPELANLLFDSSQIDFSIIPSLITIAKRDAGMNDADTYYPSVARASEAEGPGDPVISISLSNEYFDAYYTFSLDGEILSKSGSAFE
jgi:MFS family permease